MLNKKSSILDKYFEFGFINLFKKHYKDTVYLGNNQKSC
jgi:hypothetical protein